MPASAEVEPCWLIMYPRNTSLQMPASVEVDKNAWIPVVEMADRGPETSSSATQTDGIFYPSATTIGNKKGAEFIKKMITVTSRDRLPKLHTFSPGKGKGVCDIMSTVDFRCVCTFRVAYAGNIWFVRPIDCNVKHCIFQSIIFLYTQTQLK